MGNYGIPMLTPRTVTPRGGLNAEERATIGLFRQASPSVVYITTLARQRDLFSLNIAEIPQGSGSGFIWNQEGHIITNFHVIQEASRRQGDPGGPFGVGCPTGGGGA